VRDPLGNIWWVVQHVEDVPADEVAFRLQDPKYAESMRHTQATLDAELDTAGRNWSSPPVLTRTDANDQAGSDLAEVINLPLLAAESGDRDASQWAVGRWFGSALCRP
jgi:hypothetical protein